MIKRVSIYIDGADFVYGLKFLHPKYLEVSQNPIHFSG